jgi:hypothetical protein
MLDGRIDAQGTIKELRAQGILEEITHDASVDAKTEEVDAAEIKAVEEPSAEPGTDVKKPRKLIKDEHREEGGVKWSVYKRYLKAS